MDSSDEPGAASVAAVKPSIAVLPLVNMSGDPEQEFFADGISEDIITELSRFRGLFVISRTSSFAYKGKQANVQEVARELGVQFVVEGSVRKAGNRVRITVQLIDAEADRHVWAERYDRDLEDIFAIQDEVTQSIVGTLPGRIEAVSRERAEQKPTGNMAAYEYVLTGKRLHHRSTREDNVKALSMLESASGVSPSIVSFTRLSRSGPCGRICPRYFGLSGNMRNRSFTATLFALSGALPARARCMAAIHSSSIRRLPQVRGVPAIHMSSRTSPLATLDLRFA